MVKFSSLTQSYGERQEDDLKALEDRILAKSRWTRVSTMVFSLLLIVLCSFLTFYMSTPKHGADRDEALRS